MRLVILGGGTAGITLALRFLEKTHDTSVLIVESGPFVPSGDRRTWLDFVARGMNHDPHAHLLEKSDDQEDAGGRVLEIMRSRYFGVGGTTNVWGGWCVRYQPEDFYLRTNTGYGADWPFDIETLRPYYERAERTLWVAGEDKPNAAIPYTQKDGVIIETLEKLGVSYEHLPLARRETCVTIGTCKYCPIEKRYLPHPDLRVLTTTFATRFSMRSDTVAESLVLRSSKECVGVRVRPRAVGSTELIEADVVVLALGAIETPKLLLASKSPECPTGIGNGSNHVGRHITAHPLVQVVGQRTSNKDELEQPLDFPTLASRHFDTRKFQSVGKLFFVNDSRSRVVKIEERLRGGESLGAIRDSLRMSMPFELRGFVEVFSDDKNYVELGPPVASYPGSKTQVRFKTRVNFSQTPLTASAVDWAEQELKTILRPLCQRSCRPLLGSRGVPAKAKPW